MANDQNSIQQTARGWDQIAPIKLTNFILICIYEVMGLMQK